MVKSTKTKLQNKPSKPHADFPLFPHATKRWAKKIRGKFHYFGPWDDPDGALEKFNRDWPWLSQGLTPPHTATGDGLTVAELCNEFLNSKRLKLESGELSESSFRDYFRVCGVLVDHFEKGRRVDDLRPDDFQKFRRSLSMRLGVVTLRNEINRFRIIFKFAHDQRLIDRQVHFGQGFDKPAAKELRRARNQAGSRMIESEELRRLLDEANPVVKAMTLLGVNCGFGNSDCASLPKSAIDFENGWVDYPRVKTEIHRRVPLWPETVEALQEAIELRPNPKKREDSDLCFITVQGNKWVRIEQKKSDDDSVRIVKSDTITSRFSALLKKLKINGQKGLGFAL